MSHPVSHPLTPDTGPLGDGGAGPTTVGRARPTVGAGAPGQGAAMLAITPMTRVTAIIAPKIMSSFFCGLGGFGSRTGMCASVALSARPR
ncbi:hypothetical protein TPA0909_16840 [Streptomyces albus]|nr:hypothetical protein TPA0909_16840 [Streptomyces albus]